MGKETLGNDINIEFAIPDNAIPKPMAQKDVDTGAVIKIRDYYDGTKLNLKALEKIGKVQVQCLLEDKKKLTRITISSYFDHSSGVMFGEFADAEKKVHKRYSILKPAYDLDLTKPAQMKEFLALMSERFTFGGLKPEAPFLFKVVSKNKEKELEEEKADMIESAFEHIRSASENQRINMGVMIGLFGWHDLSDKQRKAQLQKIAGENPELIIKTATDVDAEYILLFHSAKNIGLIKERAGLYYFKTYELGSDIEDVKRYWKKNATVFDLVKDAVASSN